MSSFELLLFGLFNLFLNILGVDGVDDDHFRLW